MSQPLFVLSSGRCGSTLFGRLLAATGQCSVWGEHGGILMPIAASYFSAVDSGRVRSNIFGSDVVAWENWFNEEQFSDGYRRLVRHLFCGDEAKRYWGFKEVRYGNGDRVIEFLSHIFPESTFVFLVREPVSNIASQINAGHRGNMPVRDRAALWAKQNGYFLTFMESGNGHVMRYEDFTDPDNPALAELFEALGLPMTDEVDRARVKTINAKAHEISDIRSDEDMRAILDITEPVRSRLGY